LTSTRSLSEYYPMLPQLLSFPLSFGHSGLNSALGAHRFP
jgi:hypothetical protein